MLTKEQIVAFWDWHECNCKFAFDSPTSFEVCNQAIAAIDLAAENERLKAELAEYAETFSEQNNALSDHIIKLDAVKAECLKPIMITSDVFGGGVAAGHNILKQAVLAIIKDGDDK